MFTVYLYPNDGEPPYKYEHARDVVTYPDGRTVVSFDDYETVVRGGAILRVRDEDEET